MGHVNEHVEDAYMHGIEDERLEAVAETVRRWWLAGKPKKRKGIHIRNRR
jgi:hypothetical protein